MPIHIHISTKSYSTASLFLCKLFENDRKHLKWNNLQHGEKTFTPWVTSVLYYTAKHSLLTSLKVTLYFVKPSWPTDATVPMSSFSLCLPLSLSHTHAHMHTSTNHVILSTAQQLWSFPILSTKTVCKYWPQNIPQYSIMHAESPPLCISSLWLSVTHTHTHKWTVCLLQLCKTSGRFTPYKTKPRL